MSSGGKMKAVNDLVENLIKVIDFTGKLSNSSVDDSVFPHVVSKSNLDKQKDIILGKRTQPTPKNLSHLLLKNGVLKRKETFLAKEKKQLKFFHHSLLLLHIVT